jgi:hypothetical protein
VIGTALRLEWQRYRVAGNLVLPPVLFLVGYSLLFDGAGAQKYGPKLDSLLLFVLAAGVGFGEFARRDVKFLLGRLSRTTLFLSRLMWPVLLGVILALTWTGIEALEETRRWTVPLLRTLSFYAGLLISLRLGLGAATPVVVALFALPKLAQAALGLPVSAFLDTHRAPVALVGFVLLVVLAIEAGRHFERKDWT